MTDLIFFHKLKWFTDTVAATAIHMEDGAIIIIALPIQVMVVGDPTGIMEIKIGAIMATGAIGIDGMLQVNGIGEIDGAHPAILVVMAIMVMAQVMAMDIMVWVLQGLVNQTLEDL